MLQTRKQKCHQQHLPFLAHPHQRNVSDFCQGLCLKTPLHGDTTRPKAPTVCQALLQPHLAARSLQNQKPHNLVFQALGTDHGLSEPSETDTSSHCPCSRTGKGHPVGGCKRGLKNNICLNFTIRDLNWTTTWREAWGEELCCTGLSNPGVPSNNCCCVDFTCCLRQTCLHLLKEIVLYGLFDLETIAAVQKMDSHLLLQPNVPPTSCY
nr:uncharacterized protein LOC110360565 [Columba livia]